MKVVKNDKEILIDLEEIANNLSKNENELKIDLLNIDENNKNTIENHSHRSNDGKLKNEETMENKKTIIVPPKVVSNFMKMVYDGCRPIQSYFD